MQVNILEAKNRLSQLIKAALAGEDVIIANRGEPMVRLVPTGKARLQQGSAKRILDWLKKNPRPAYGRRTAEEIDADIEAERKSWD